MDPLEGPAAPEVFRFLGEGRGKDHSNKRKRGGREEDGIKRGKGHLWSG